MPIFVPINRDKDSGRFAPKPDARQVSEKKVDEVAVKIAERAGACPGRT